MRSKENAEDYRYFPEPNLLPILVTEEQIAQLRKRIPMLPAEKKKRYMQTFGLASQDAEQLAWDPSLSSYFDASVSHTEAPVTLAHLMLSELLRLNTSDPFFCPIAPAHMGALATLLKNGTLNSSTAKRLIEEIWETNHDPVRLVQEHNLAQISSRTVLLPLIREALAQNPQAKIDYQNGKHSAAKVITGAVMAKTQGKANPIVVNRLIEQEWKQ